MARARNAQPHAAAVSLCAVIAVLLAISPLAPAAVARAASGCSNVSASPQDDNLGQIRAAVLCLINQERERHGESALIVNPKLTRAAQGHSEDMASADYFSHVGPSGDTPLSRMRGSGYIYSSRIGYEVGENIAWGTMWLASPQAIVAAWMASPGHRANILNGRFRETGVGVSPHAPAAFAEGQPGALYTQDFGVLTVTGHAARSHRGAGSGGAHHSSRRSGRITSGARTTERSHEHHGSPRRQVRHRHRVRTRHRARHRRAAHRARRARAHQRSRR